MLRIGIVTLHCSYNFGSALQAYALQTILRRMGYEAVIIDYRSVDFDHYRIFSLRHPSVTKATLENISKLPAMLKRRQSFQSFSDCYLKLTDETFHYENPGALTSLQNTFDYFVCGSDQIWNLDMTGGVDDTFFLSFAGTKRRIAYAASLGHTSFRPENFDRALISSLLERFDYVSVREEEAVPIIQPLTTRDVKVVLDPTLLLGGDEYSSILGMAPRGKDYIFVYLLRHSPELIESAKSISETTDKRVLYVSEHNLPIPNSKNLFGVGPGDFVSLISNAKYVLTNSFHAMIFSILFHVPFRVFAADATASRIRDLLGKLGVSELCSAEVCSEPIIEPDWDLLDQRIAFLREDSLHFLKEALS